MKIVADKNIPYLKGIAEKYGDVAYIAGKDFDAELVKDADTLIVRTITYLGKDILEGSNVKLICSATIGYDHIDTEYCEKNGITWKNAPGSNSGSVMQYVVSALIKMAQQKGFSLSGKTIGIVGVGNVGRKIAHACQLLGMKVLLNDPPREETEGKNSFVDLKEIAQEADIISFHTPLTKEGKYKTYHLADDSFFNSLIKKPVIINTARGGIIDTISIKKALSKNIISGAIIDCWENEPNINTEYMQAVDIATPHIAGYSADGKANATRMSLENLADYWGLSKDPINNITIPEIENSIINFQQLKETDKISEAILKTYDSEKDSDELLRNPEQFTVLRCNYPLRREYRAYTVLNSSEKESNILKSLGFIVK